ncbi:uncharacterized protein J4E78_004636 [Alternaria triticimaculans]|uniref:uncharacterized protein n=2 Tax=Alternaria sect. Infectoriae TaxID=2499258 RepID=UPI0020C59B60|nr:uncharacterized protein J4E78_004636 [Alternaria triticimaculans]KAI4661846.1 hypothetical protein J4E78_004636 [Alternaria triticimaculans]
MHSHETLPQSSNMASTPSTPNLREQIEATARAFLSAFEEGAAQSNPSIINRDVTADCTRHLLPASVPKAFGLATDSFFDTTSFQDLFGNDIKVLLFKDNIMSNLIVDTEARSAAFTAKSDVYVRSSGETYPFEGAWFLYFNEDGSKIKKVVEFCEKDAILKMASDVAAA